MFTGPPVTSPGSDTRPHGRVGDGDVARVRFRRALALLLMTLVLPGSAQLVAGNQRVGRIALRVVLVLVATTAFVVLLGWKWHGVVYFLASNTFMLGLLRLVLCALAVGWALLFLDAWRLGQPLELRQKQRLVVVGLNGLLCFSVAGGLLFASHVVAVQRGFIAAMFGDGVASAATDGRYNILLLGGDSGADRWGLRPDSISVASIDQDTGKAIIFGLPRNMTDFPFAEGSVMHKAWPHGFNCGYPNCELNGVNTWVGDHQRLFKGVKNPGMDATISAIEGITGLKINYWSFVNLAGFRGLVDAVGGVTLHVRQPIPVGGLGSDVTGYIKPGTRKLNGYDTLWFARSRDSSDDYSRMARQKCVMNAMLHQLSPTKVLKNFGAIASAGKQIISTSIPASELDTFVNLSMKTKSLPVATVSFVPPKVNTSDPDYQQIRSMVTTAVAASQAKDDGKTTPKPHRHQPRDRTANDSDNLSSAC